MGSSAKVGQEYTFRDSRASPTLHTHAGPPMRRRDRRREVGRDPFDPLDGPISETIDLHQWTREHVQAQLSARLRTARRREPGALVHVITGKGRNSPAGPVLRPLVQRMLRDSLLPDVAAWGRDQDDGGFLLRLRR